MIKKILSICSVCFLSIALVACKTDEKKEDTKAKEDPTVERPFTESQGTIRHLLIEDVKVPIPETVGEYEKYLSQIGKKVELIPNPNKPDTITKMDDTLKANQTSSLMAYFKVYISDSKWQKFVLHYKNPTDRTTKVANGKIDRIILYNDHLQENPVKDELKTIQSITFSTDNGNLVMNNKSTSAHVMKIMGGAPQQNTDGYLIYNDPSGFVYNFATMNQKGTLTQFEIVYPRK